MFLNMCCFFSSFASISRASFELDLWGTDLTQAWLLLAYGGSNGTWEWEMKMLLIKPFVCCTLTHAQWLVYVCVCVCVWGINIYERYSRMLNVADLMFFLLLSVPHPTHNTLYAHAIHHTHTHIQAHEIHIWEIEYFLVLSFCWLWMCWWRSFLCQFLFYFVVAAFFLRDEKKGENFVSFYVCGLMNLIGIVLGAF